MRWYTGCGGTLVHDSTVLGAVVHWVHGGTLGAR